MRLAALIGIAAACALFIAAPAVAQPYQPDLAEQRAAMDRLAPLVGAWQGQANVRGPHATLVHQTERVERDLDGLLLVIHGTGYATAEHTGAPIFQAIAVISYDDRRDIYEFRTYNNGFATTATGAFLDNGDFRWSIDTGGPVQMRFTIDFDESSWREAGEMSRDNGQSWAPTVDLTLTRAP